MSRELAWHQAVKYGIARCARTQPAVKAVDVEWTLQSGHRRTDVHVRLHSGREFAVEVKYSPIDAALRVDRQRDYYEAGVTPIWLYSIGLTAPRWAGDNITFGIRLGPVMNTDGRRDQLELGVPFSTPGRVDPWATATPEDYIGYAPFRPHAQNGVLWMPIGSAALTDSGVIVAPNPLEVLRAQGLAEAEAAADRHNKGREWLIRDARARSHQRYLAGAAESACRSATRAPRPTGVVCQGCGGALDPILRRYGRHPGC